MDLSHASVDTLIRACAELGDEEAWAEFITRFHKDIEAMIVKACRQWGGIDLQTRDDIAQAIYLKICSMTAEYSRILTKGIQIRFTDYLK